MTPPALEHERAVPGQHQIDAEYLTAEDAYTKAAQAYSAEDFLTASRPYRLSAEQDFVNAQLNLDVLYTRGEGVSVDYVEACFWCDLAAAAGNEIVKKYKVLT